jgi:lipoate-protein ligase A
MATVRLLPFVRAEAAWNMAADEVMLQAAANGLASLRFYAWEGASVSLGYFQESTPVQTHPRLASLPLVRRASGGSALVHHHEITYALALPAQAHWGTRRENWLQNLHLLVSEVLVKFGVHATSCQVEERLGPILCFLHQTPQDLLIGDSKILGSAQRKQRDGLLQHGGILLAQSPYTPELPGILETTGITIDPVHLQEALILEFSQRFRCEIEPGDWSGEERRNILEVAANRYASDDWTLRR